MHHHIVGLEAIHIPYPEFAPELPHKVTLTSHITTSPAELKERVKDATIIIATTVKITAEILSPECTPKLQAVAVMAAGYDHVDIEAAKARGIKVFNCPHASSEVVANHALGLYFAARRKTVTMHNLMTSEPSEWKAKGSVIRYMRTAAGEAPLTVADEVCGIIGYGAIGKRIEAFAKALGMQVLISSRKNNTSAHEESSARVPFSEVLRRSTVLMILVPKTTDTLNLVSASELQSMNPHAVVINISRGGIVDEAAVVEALRNGQIAGYATDVFAVEPAEGARDSPLLAPDVRGLNLTLTPHVAWFGERTRSNLVRMLKSNVEQFIAGNPQNIVV